MVCDSDAYFSFFIRAHSFLYGNSVFDAAQIKNYEKLKMPLNLKLRNLFLYNRLVNENKK